MADATATTTFIISVRSYFVVKRFVVLSLSAPAESLNINHTRKSLYGILIGHCLWYQCVRPFKRIDTTGNKSVGYSYTRQSSKTPSLNVYTGVTQLRPAYLFPKNATQLRPTNHHDRTRFTFFPTLNATRLYIFLQNSNTFFKIQSDMVFLGLG